MKKLLILIPLLFIVLLVGCNKETETKIDVKVVDYHTKIVVEEKTKKEEHYLIVVDVENNTYFLEVKKSMFSKIEKTYPVDTILTVNVKELVKVIE